MEHVQCGAYFSLPLDYYKSVTQQVRDSTIVTSGLVLEVSCIPTVCTVNTSEL